eukprot:CAMPEP_0206050536 /NCGR_PEP_ID=MMETSP1466-20131121/29439_1 /ASSEMBLY_ACC=CAM_ASM_001126 /TAXON_ID=44452 /ORGANISM="Pavlova gyrans, Strain CCMP608" /LENGTH=458 /DNA_ID=CAMNT_0053425653 /DNA_START=9 /DNA_END=1385 /DNA_ORIENTATION=+
MSSNATRRKRVEPEPLWSPELDQPLEVTAHDKTHNMAVAASALWLMDGDPQVAATHLRGRAAAMLVANPWLAACCKKDKNWVYPRELKTQDLSTHFMDRHFSEGTAQLSTDSYMDLNAALSGFLCKNVLDIAGTMLSAFRVSLVRDLSAEDRFAVVLSVNHVLADGATMYALGAMLGNNNSVRELSAKRVAGFPEAQERAVGKAEKDLFSFAHAGFTLGLVNGVLGDLIRGRPRDVLMTEVAPDWLRNAKAQAAREAGLPFVSTNDVLTSLIFAGLDPARVGLMEVNIRGRGGDGFACTAADAGNYTFMAPFFAGDAATPGDVRRAFHNGDDGHLVVRRHKKTPIPGFFGINSGPGGFVAVSNWSSVDVGPPTIPGATFVAHLPMMDISVPSPFDGALIWAPQPGHVGILAFSRKPGLLPSAHPAFGQRVLGFQTMQRAAHRKAKGGTNSTDTATAAH